MDMKSKKESTLTAESTLLELEKCASLLLGFRHGACTWEDVQRKALKMLAAEALYDALKDVPNPEDEGRCYLCPRDYPKIIRDTIRGYPRAYFLHSPDCWYGKVQAALALADKENNNAKS